MFTIILDNTKHKIKECICEKVVKVIIKHNYSLSFVEHEGIRDVHSYLKPDFKHISRNTAKDDV
jgi:hypothetical protein